VATTPGALNRAIFARLRGTETPALSGDAATAQVRLAALVPKWRLSTLTEEADVPCGNIYVDAPVDAMPEAVDVGIIQYSIRRFEIWSRQTDAAFYENVEDALEQLFDERRGAPALPLDGDGRVFESALFTGLQGPFRDDPINAYYSLISFRFVEARP
jgi:hypothetical protein